MMQHSFLRRTVSLLALLLPAWAAWADSGTITAVKIHSRSGTDVTILLENQPVVTFENDELVITTLTNTLSYVSSEYVRFTYVDNGVLTDMNNLSRLGVLISFEKDCLKVQNLVPKAQVSVYTVDGKLIASARTDAQGHAILALPELPGGVYVVKTNAVTFKLRKP